jgi:hypothetical protein
VVLTEISGKDEILFSISFEGITHVGHKESKSVIHVVQRCRAKAFMIKEANCSTRLLNFYSHIPISKKKQIVRRQNTW